MTPEQFVFWLRGYFASGNPSEFTRGDWKTVADMLARVAAAARTASLPRELNLVPKEGCAIPPGYPPLSNPRD